MTVWEILNGAIKKNAIYFSIATNAQELHVI